MLGGTFDPPHVGHLVTAVNVRHLLDLDVVLMVVANEPWQKVGSRVITPASHRLDLVSAAVRDVEGVEASDIEVRRGIQHVEQRPHRELAPLVRFETELDLHAIDSSRHG